MINLVAIAAIITLMISVNGLYVAAEFATVSSRRTRIHRLAGEGNPLAKSLLAIMEDGRQLDDYVAACQLGITISSLVLGAFGQNRVATDLLPSLTALLQWSGLNVDVAAAANTAAFLIVIVSFTTLQVLLGELLPKSISIQYPETVAMAVVYPLRVSMFILRPLIWFFNGSGRVILKLLGQQTHKESHAHIHSPEEIEILVTESAQGGLLDSEERQMLRNAFRMRDLVAREVMVHRTRLASAPVESSPMDLIELALAEGYTRIPLYQGTIDNVKGFVHIKDVFRLYIEQKENLAEIMREVVHVPESLAAADVWETLRNKRQYIAIVFDEYGGTAGMITVEDLIEEIFGELQDEFDDETAVMSLDKEGRIYLRGDLLITDVNEYLELQLPTEDADTLSGLIFSTLERTPKVGDTVQFGDTEIRVELLEDLGVEEVSLLKPTLLDLPHIEEWGIEERD
ncbi:MAG: hemolysin family protein [Anaerolineae bacterium]|nr:hemolysin family protein [Anaerolineae bacterium]